MFLKISYKHLCQSLFFIKVAGLGPTTLLKKRLWHKWFHVNFVKFLRTPFLIEHVWTTASVFTNLFRANITVRTRSNLTKKLYWLFTKEIIALTSDPTSLSRLAFYPRPTVIYVLVFLTSVVLFYKKLPFLYQTWLNPLLNITKPLLILFSFRLKIIPNYRSICVSIRFLERIDSYPIHLVSLSEWERSNPSPLWKSCREKYVPMETEGLSDMKIGTEQ